MSGTSVVAASLFPAAIVIGASILGARGHHEAAAIGGICGVALYAAMVVASAVVLWR